jgi:hypothetical protein
MRKARLDIDLEIDLDNKIVQTNVRLPKYLYNYLHREAFNRNISQSELIAIALCKLMNDDKNID